MKLYIYYLLDQEILSKLNNLHVLDSFGPKYEKGKPFLYAYTTNKKVNKLFRYTRNMDKFLYKEVDISNDDELDKFDREFGGFSEISLCNLKYALTECIAIPMTSGEYWYTVECRRETIGELFKTIPKIDIRIFCPKIQKVLRDLRYDIEILGVDREPESDVEKFLIKFGYKNEFYLFTKIYSGILNIENIMEVLTIEWEKKKKIIES